MNGGSETKRSGRYDALIVGAGFAGLYMLYRLREAGLRAIVLEAGGDVGGTWYWNRYPGARCDVQSSDYSYSFRNDIQQEWTWSELFAAQPEILAYANYVADKLKLRRDIRFDTRVTAATFVEASAEWRISTEHGDTLEATFCIMATGCLSKPKIPDIAGTEDFGGNIYFTSLWPHHPVDFRGKRIAVVGTGSSGIQAIPKIAEQADQVIVFQRTPSFTLPARNRTLTAKEIADLKAKYPERRVAARLSPNCGLRPTTNRVSASVTDDERHSIYEESWNEGGITFGATFADLLVNEEANRFASDFVRAKIDATIRNPETARLLKPYHYPIGTRRICIDTDYFDTFNRDHVTLVDALTDPIERLDAKGIVTQQARYDVDAIVFATGFDAMTGALLAVDIRGRDGQTLRDKWKHGPRTYLGLSTAGFPNFFFITGPGSPSVLSNMVGAIEQHVEWIAALLQDMHANGHTGVEADSTAEEDWVREVNDAAERTLLPKANSWFTGANIPGKPRMFMPYVGGCDVYRAICNDVAAQSYRGFTFDPGPAAEQA